MTLSSLGNGRPHACDAPEVAVEPQPLLQADALETLNLYYKPKGESAEIQQIMELMAMYYTEHPTSGVRTMVNMLSQLDITANSKRVRRLLRKMGILVIYPKKCLSKGGKESTTLPSLSAVRDGHHKTQSGVEHGHKLHTHEERLHCMP